MCRSTFLVSNAVFSPPIRSTRSSTIKRWGTGLARSACVIGGGRSGLPWAAWLGLPTQIFFTCQKKIQVAIK
jgi:hypothetical protein